MSIVSRHRSNESRIFSGSRLKIFLKPEKFLRKIHDPTKNRKPVLPEGVFLKNVRRPAPSSGISVRDLESEKFPIVYSY